MADAATSNAALLNLIAGLPKTLFGSKSSVTTTGGGSVTTSGFSKEALDALLKGILEGTGGGTGLAAVAAGQKIPGLYNSTSRNLLINDFTTRAAAQVAQAGATKTTVDNPKTVTTKTPGAVDSLGGMGTLAALGGLALGSKKGKALAKDLYDGVAETLGFNTDSFGNKSTVADWTSGFDIGTGGSLPPVSMLDSFGNASIASDWISGFDVADVAAAGVDFFGNTSTVADWTSGFDLAGGGDLVADGLSTAGIGQLLQGDVGQAGVQAGIAAIPGVGPVLAGIDAITGGAISEGPGAVANDLLGGIEDAFGLGGDGSVICTELAAQGLLAKAFLRAETNASRKFYSAATFAGYHKIAIPVVRAMRKSPKLSAFLLPWAIAHGNSICFGKHSFRSFFIDTVLWPVCYITGLVCGEQNYKSLYQGV